MEGGQHAGFRYDHRLDTLAAVFAQDGDGTLVIGASHDDDFIWRD
jgi:hypothetical protein